MDAASLVMDVQEDAIPWHSKRRALSYSRVHLHKLPRGIEPARSRWYLDLAIERYPDLILQQDGFTSKQALSQFGSNSVYADVKSQADWGRNVGFELLPGTDAISAVKAAKTWDDELLHLHLWDNQQHIL